MAQKMTERLHSFDFSEECEDATFVGVHVTDYYRRGRPYRLFTAPSVSKVDISFDVPRVDNVKAINVRLNHCRTNCHGMVDFHVNGVLYKEEYGDSRWDNFGEQAFPIDASMIEPGRNTFTITLNSQSAGVYWLSDATIDVEYLAVNAKSLLSQSKGAILQCVTGTDNKTKRTSVIDDLPLPLELKSFLKSDI